MFQTNVNAFSIARVPLFLLILHDYRYKVSYLVGSWGRREKGVSHNARRLIAKGEATPSFRARWYTLPPSDLFYLLHLLLLSPSLVSSRLILFPSPSAFRSLHLPQARKLAGRSDPLSENKSQAGSLAFFSDTTARRVFNFLRFSFSTQDFISLRYLPVFYATSV